MTTFNRSAMVTIRLEKFAKHCPELCIYPASML
jgi:hypothetical protein